MCIRDSAQCAAAVEHVSRAGGTPLLVARDHRILGVVYLKDIVKHGIKENFADLRTMGIKTVMITGDNPLKMCIRDRYSGGLVRAGAFSV